MPDYVRRKQPWLGGGVYIANLQSPVVNSSARDPPIGVL